MMNDQPLAHADDMLRLDRQICFPLYAASNLLSRLYRPVLAQFNLTYPQYLVMLVLWEKESCTVGELGHHLFLDSGTLTPLLKRLTAQGLVNRARDPHDERRVLITLTEQGKALRQQAVIVPHTLAQSLNLNPEQVEQLRQQAQHIAAIMSHAIEQSS